MKTANLKSHTTSEMSWNIYFQVFTVRTWRKRLSNLNTFLTPRIYWGIHTIFAQSTTSTGQKGFRLDHCIEAIEASVDVKANRKKIFTVKKQYSYL